MNMEELAYKLNKPVVTKKDLEDIVFEKQEEVVDLTSKKNDVMSWEDSKTNDGLGQVVPEQIDLTSIKEIHKIPNPPKENVKCSVDKSTWSNKKDEGIEGIMNDIKNPNPPKANLIYENKDFICDEMPDLNKVRITYTPEKVKELINAFPYAIPNKSINQDNKNEMLKLAGVVDEPAYIPGALNEEVVNVKPSEVSNLPNVRKKKKTIDYVIESKPRSDNNLRDVNESTRLLWRQLSGVQKIEDDIIPYVEDNAQKCIISSIDRLVKENIKSKINVNWSKHKNPEKNILKINEIETKYNLLQLYTSYNGLLSIVSSDEAANIVGTAVVNKLKELFI